MCKIGINKIKKIIILIEILILAILVSLSLGAEANYYLMTATAYCPCELCCGKWADGFTSTGAIARKGCIAIDPTNGPLKMGQVVWVEGYGLGICNDTGSAIKGWKIDVCFKEHQEALNWGIKLVKVYVISEIMPKGGV